MEIKKKDANLPSDDRTGVAESYRFGATPGQKFVGLTAAVLGAVIAVGGVAYKFWWLPAHRTDPNATVQQQATPPSAPSLNVPLALGNTAPAPAQQTTPFPQPTPPGLAPVQPQQPMGQQPYGQQPQRDPAAEAAKKAAEEIQKRKLASNMGGLPGTGQSNLTPVSAQAGGAPGGAPAGPAPIGQGNTSNALSAQMRSTDTPMALAGYIQNQDMTIIKGTTVNCTLDTVIDSDAPGFVSCITTEPVYSMNHHVVLMEAGTKIDGEHVTVPKRGVRRLPVLFGRAVTPTGVTISLTSPGTDTLGGAGLTGYIDNHYCERYCGALMFSLLEDGVQLGQAALQSSKSGNGTTVVLPSNTISGGQSIAGEMLRQGSDIQPTFTKRQGESIAITIARDLDFSSIYQLKPNVQ
ncbi:TPA: TrbI/VirB10 family protein [Burkholderia cepacia]